MGHLQLKTALWTDEDQHSSRNRTERTTSRVTVFVAVLGVLNKTLMNSVLINLVLHCLSALPPILRMQRCTLILASHFCPTDVDVNRMKCISCINSVIFLAFSSVFWGHVCCNINSNQSTYCLRQKAAAYTPDCSMHPRTSCFLYIVYTQACPFKLAQTFLNRDFLHFL